MWEWLLIPAGLVTLIVGADFLVRGSVAIALHFGIRPIVAGLTIVAFGTSAPELAASITAALEGSSGLATGTVLGSNIANIGLILGLTALVKPINNSFGSARFEVRCLLIATLLSPVPMLIWGEISRPVGLVMFGGLVWFTTQLLRRERARPVPAHGDQPRSEGSAKTIHWVMAVGGLAALPLGAEWLVTGAKSLALTAGVSPQVIGIAVVAVGTSLPELAASITAAARGHPELAVGNVVGSNLFNLCMVLGGTAMISPLPLTWAGEGVHLMVGIAFTVALALVLRSQRGLGRGFGAVMLASYAGYMALTLIRG